MSPGQVLPVHLGQSGCPVVMIEVSISTAHLAQIAVAQIAELPAPSVQLCPSGIGAHLD